MSHVLQLIERAKKFVPRNSEYALCKALDIPQSALIKIKRGKGFFGPKQRVRLHEITGISLDEITAMLEIERAKNEKDKAFWSDRLPRISAACVIGIVAFAALKYGNPDALSAGLFLISRPIRYAKY